MTFTKWLDTLIEEKGLDTDAPFQVEGASGVMNYMTLENVLEAIKSTSANEQAQIKTTLVKIDFVNGDMMHFFKHLAKAIAI